MSHTHLLPPARVMAVVALVAGLFPAANHHASAADAIRLWETTGFDKPESVLLNPATNTLLVSNNGAGKGFISEIGPDGAIIRLHRVDGLAGARGMALVAGHLFVAEREELADIDLAADAVVKRYAAPGAVFLNDLVATPDGRIYATDTGNGAIYALADGAFTVWLQAPELVGANGIALDGNRLLVGLTRGMPAPPAPIKTVDLATKTIGDLGSGTPVAAADGMATLPGGSLLVTDNAAGRLLKIRPDGSATAFAVLAPGTAGLAVVPTWNEVVVTEMPQDSLVAVPLATN